MAATKLDSEKPNADKPNTDMPASAPELSDAQRQKIESELTVDDGDLQAVPEQDVKADIQAKGIDLDSLVIGDPDKSDADGKSVEPAKTGGKIRRFFVGYWRRKRWTIPLTLLVIVSILAAVPYTRIKLASYVISQPVTIKVIDSTTQKPVSSVDIVLDGSSYKTDKDGKVTVQEVKVGDHSFTATKKYYQDTSFMVSVPINRGISHEVRLKAVGRQVPIMVVNKISGKPVENATLKSAGSEFKTDKDGKVTIVLPADKAELPIALTAAGFNSLETKVKVTDQTVKENTFSLVSSGKAYFLSRLSGKIDVVKTDLDGGNRAVVVAGTGKEDDRGTVLLASRDWKYLAFLAKRDSGLARLYIIDTSTDKMSEMDSGDAAFNLVGWDDHTFVYQVNRSKSNYYDANKVAFKSYNADKKQVSTIDQNATAQDAGASYYQDFGPGYLIDHKLIYTVSWYVNAGYSNATGEGKEHSLRVASFDGITKKDVKTWPFAQYSGSIQTIPYSPGELYLTTWSNTNAKDVFYEYESGQVKDADGEVNSSKFQTAYPTYLQSPDTKRTFWSEQRDGRQAFFVGDTSGTNGKQVALLNEEDQVYGWYSDSYVLISKKGSELYILPVDGGTPLKVAAYHKPQLSYRGYGGGYGGL